MSAIPTFLVRLATMGSAALLFTSTANAACVYSGKAAKYMGCVYDEVTANGAAIYDLQNDVAGLFWDVWDLQDDVADLQSQVAGVQSYYTRENTMTVSPGYVGTLTAGCYSGDQVISGGWALGGAYAYGMAGEHIVGNRPNTSSTGWTAILYNDTHNTGWNVTITFTVTAICLDR